MSSLKEENGALEGSREVDFGVRVFIIQSVNVLRETKIMEEQEITSI